LRRIVITTIAYRWDDDRSKGGTMASDSACISDGTTHVGGTKKVWRVGKCLIGICGDLAACLAFIEWFKAGADDADCYPWSEEIEALVTCPDGSMKTYHGNSMEPIEYSKRESYIAIGSGLDIALGCMYQGGGAIDAVRAAIKYNTNSKGPVRSYRMII
jgi:hypothetical protein